jgi:DNA-binding CsgD family transcriptional regulator
MRSQGEIARSVALLEESLAGFRQRGDVRWVAVAQTMLGYSLQLQGDSARAERLILAGLAGHRAVGDRAFELYSLLNLAAICAARAQPERAAQLLGALAALCETLGVAVAPVNQPDLERVVAATRAQLSGAAYDRAWEAGHTLPLDQALDEAVPPAPAAELAPAAPAAAAYPAGLTAREVEVLRLVAQGLTNSQVAERLCLSPRTVENHLRSIYGKLGVSTRAAATHFAVSHDLA